VAITGGAGTAPVAGTFAPGTGLLAPVAGLPVPSAIAVAVTSDSAATTKTVDFKTFLRFGQVKASRRYYRTAL
jgi:hypothetical protein